MKSSMTEQEVNAFREWHEKRLIECKYPIEIVEKLRSDRERWLPRPSKEKA